MTSQERIDLLMKARNLLHKQEAGKKITDLDIVLAHDQIDMVIDDMVYERNMCAL